MRNHFFSISIIILIAGGLGGVLTNIVNLDVSPVGWKAPLFAERLLGYGIKAKVCTEHTLRMVTHNDIGDREVSFVLDRIGDLLRSRT